MNQMKSGLVNDNGSLSRTHCTELGINLDPGTQNVRMGLLNKIKDSFPGDSSRTDQAKWLCSFYAGFDMIRQQRISLIRRGTLEGHWSPVLMFLCDNNPAVAEPSPIPLIFTTWTNAAKELGLQSCFPSPGRLWPAISESMVSSIDSFTFDACSFRLKVCK
ncbi:hypothetical protein [Acanthopleuribacter pedis]|uniref:Uncharacterized protein n=1 Tax=Acanthopleuribacter pedis TaxID=442870 RepID=A0A8J7Q4B6_9BACT|nr:hypothetical protein [Acanthopleuribacter pedis]MBO1320332.1 hypothetical protein [Acanthopleuribacter pedis]